MRKVMAACHASEKRKRFAASSQSVAAEQVGLLILFIA